MTEENWENLEAAMTDVYVLSIKQMPVNNVTPDIAYNSGYSNLKPIKKVSAGSPKKTWIESTTTVTPAKVNKSKSIEYRLIWSDSETGTPLKKAKATVYNTTSDPTGTKSSFYITGLISDLEKDENDS
ncbi:MAG: hypothetical protein NTV43_01215 [Methylococcales bacterium]|nr:hypothetical protein [Methylococcales bacterium]